MVTNTSAHRARGQQFTELFNGLYMDWGVQRVQQLFARSYHDIQ